MTLMGFPFLMHTTRVYIFLVVEMKLMINLIDFLYMGANGQIDGWMDEWCAAVVAININNSYMIMIRRGTPYEYNMQNSGTNFTSNANERTKEETLAYFDVAFQVKFS